jgi:hypothetical protein
MMTEYEITMSADCPMRWCRAVRGDTCISTDGFPCGAHGSRRLVLARIPKQRRQEYIDHFTRKAVEDAEV